jgi:hypothetical protein
MVHPADKKAGPVYHQIGNIWDKRLKYVIDELIELIEAGIYLDEEIDIDVLRNAKYVDGFPCFEVEAD